MFQPQVRSAVHGLRNRLGRAYVWCFAVTAGTDATHDGILRELGLTAANQCTSFSAYVLAGFNRTGCVAKPMDLASSKNPLYLVDQHHNRSCCYARLAGNGIGQSSDGSTKPYGRTDAGRISVSILYRPTAGSVTHRLRCGLAFQRPEKLGINARLNSRPDQSGNELSHLLLQCQRSFSVQKSGVN